MKSFIAIAALAAALGTAAVPANALPLLGGQISVGESHDVLNVGWRCGWHRHWSWRLHRCVWTRW